MSHTVHVNQANKILNNLVNGELPTLESITSIDGLIKGLGINDVKNFVNKFNVTIEQEYTSSNKSPDEYYTVTWGANNSHYGYSKRDAKKAAIYHCMMQAAEIKNSHYIENDYYHVIVISGLADLTYSILYCNFEPMQPMTNTSPEDLIENLKENHGDDPVKLVVKLNRDNKQSTLNQPISVWSKFVDAGFDVVEGYSSFDKYGLDQDKWFNS